MSQRLVTILFTDVEGSTGLFSALGDAEAQAVLAACDALAREQVRVHGGRSVKSLGDGLMAAFASPRDAVTCALAIQTAVAERGDRHPGQRVLVRVGLHTGEATETEGDLLGESVSAAARICAKARGGEVLSSEVVRQLCGSVSGVLFGDRGRVALRGFPERWRLCEVLSQAEADGGAAPTGGLRVGVLGPLEVVCRGRTVSIGPGRERALFSLLALRGGRTVSTDELIAALWADDPPETALKTLRTYVSHLRRTLPEDAIRTVPGGYLLEVRAHDVDALRFEQLVDEARRSFEQHAIAAAIEQLREALELWRGEPLADLVAQAPGRGEAVRLRELRCGAEDDLAEARLSRGDYAALVPELERAVAAEPLRERRWGQLMRALYHSGRQGDALDAYRRVRLKLRDELGVDPTLELRRLERAILRQEVEPAWSLGPGDRRQRPAAAAGGGEVSRPRVRGLALVGRQRELQVLEAEVERAARGELRCLLLLGEPGIGKSRLATELLSTVPRPVLGLSARAYPLGESASFGVWAECLDRRLDQLGPEELLELCGGLLDDLAGLLRPVAAVRGSLPGSPTPRPRLLEGIAVVVGNLSRASPVVIVLDDVHWADASSWEALRYVAGRLATAPVLIVATARPAELADHEVATQVLLGLAQDGVLRRLTLTPIERDGLRALARAVVEREPPEALVGWLDERSRGNPLFALGLVRALVEEGGDLGAPQLRVLPEELADRVTARLRRADESSRDVLEALAVDGQPIDLGDLARITGRSVGELGPVVDRLVQVRFVTEKERGRSLEYELAHPLYGQAIYESIGARRRRIQHRQVGRTLHAAGRVSAAAPHFGCSAEPGDEEAIQVLIDALHQAEERDAYSESLALLSTLVELIPHGDERWVTVLEAMSREAEWITEHRADHHAELGIRALREIDHVLERSAADPVRRANVKLRLGSFLSFGAGELEDAERECREAVALFEEAGDSAGSLLASHELAFTWQVQGKTVIAEAEALRLLRQAETAGHRFAAMHNSALAGFSAHALAHFSLAEEMLRRSIAIAQEDGRLSQVSRASGWLAMALAHEGRVDDALAAVDVACTADPGYRDAPALQWEIVVHWAAGDYATAQRLAAESLERTRTTGGLSRRRGFGLAVGALALGEAGRWEQARATLSRASTAYRGCDFFFCTHCCRWAEAVLGWGEHRRCDSITALRRTASLLLPGMPAWAAAVLADLAEIAGEAGDRDAAAWAAGELVRLAGEVDGHLHRGLAVLARALVDATSGAADRAAEGARGAIALLSGTGWRAHQGRAYALLGRVLSEAEPEAAREAWTQAAAVFDVCGATRRHADAVARLSELR